MRNLAQYAAYSLVVMMVVAGAIMALENPAMIALVLGLIAVVFSTISPKFAWAGYLLTLGLNGQLIAIGSAQARPELVSILFLLLAIVGYRARSRGHHRVSSKSTLVWALAYLGATGLGTILVAPSLTQSGWILLQIAQGVLAFLLILYLMPWRGELIRVGTIVVGCIATVSVLGWLAATAGFISPGMLGVGVDMRLIGFSIETNIFASQLACWLAVAWASGRRMTRSERFFIGAIVVAVVLSATRAAWLAAMFLLAWILYSRYRKSVMALPAALVLVIAAVLVPPAIQAYGATQPRDSLGWRLANLLNTDEGTGAYRVDIYDNALAELAEWPRWLIGSGANSYSQYHPIDTTNRYAEYLGNVFLATAYDGGVLAFAALIATLLTTVAASANRGRSLLVVACVLICATATNIMWLQFPWVYIALGAIVPHIDPSETRKQSMTARRANVA
ncbi:O-antigen ligase family protein [Microbacterium hominis]|uniref:O-antigen ligase family protein n=1 Tax=Microbacterium hominis TaxID=162426 RepID=A0A7D4TRS9_9MICO|nr:O-antigen ligase family protein [Microbacterium hominis]QKJ20244.1 O-antigen ligase family protein [Microbacterium hominis]